MFKIVSNNFLEAILQEYRHSIYMLLDKYQWSSILIRRNRFSPPFSFPFTNVHQQHWPLLAIQLRSDGCKRGPAIVFTLILDHKHADHTFSQNIFFINIHPSTPLPPILSPTCMYHLFYKWHSQSSWHCDVKVMIVIQRFN